MKDCERRDVWFSGRVQGVGFRFTTQRLAENFEVTGFVQNLHDGRVLMVAEGAGSEIDGLISSIKRQMAANIHDIEFKISAVTKEFDSFEILR